MDESLPTEIEVISGDRPSSLAAPSNYDGVSPFVVAGIVLLLALLVYALMRGTDPEPVAPEVRDGSEARRVAQVVPPGTLAAERYRADPRADTLRDLLAAIGGLNGVTLGTAVGAFDVVSFDPLDPDRVLASLRSSYGIAQNQGLNELWVTGEAGIQQTLWAPDVEHDFTHFNNDGTITMWVHVEGDSGFGPRRAVLIDGRSKWPDAGSMPNSMSGAIYAPRSVVTDGKLFALTGDGDYYSTRSTYVDLIVDDDGQQTVLTSGAPYEWIDSPSPELVVAYPRDDAGRTAVWDATTLDPIVDHPLAGRSFERVAVSGDGRRAVGVTFEGDLVEVDLESGRTVSVFGSLDPTGINAPITLNDDGTMAITVARFGTVTVWYVGDDEPIAVIAGDSAQPRWVAERFGPRSATVVAPGASRFALRVEARTQVRTTWVLFDTSPESWVRRGCALGGGPLDEDERHALALPPGPGACG